MSGPITLGARANPSSSPSNEAKRTAATATGAVTNGDVTSTPPVTSHRPVEEHIEAPSSSSPSSSLSSMSDLWRTIRGSIAQARVTGSQLLRTRHLSWLLYVIWIAVYARRARKPYEVTHGLLNTRPPTLPQYLLRSAEKLFATMWNSEWAPLWGGIHVYWLYRSLQQMRVMEPFAVPPALALSIPVLLHAIYSYGIMATQVMMAPRLIRDTLQRHGIASTANATGHNPITGGNGNVVTQTHGHTPSTVSRAIMTVVPTSGMLNLVNHDLIRISSVVYWQSKKVEKLKQAKAAAAAAATTASSSSSSSSSASLPSLSSRMNHSEPKGKILKCDIIYHPKKRLRNAPVFMYIHGGGWIIGDRRQHANPLLYQMAHAGWLVVTISYRLSPVYRWPAHIIDCKRAIRWIREHAHEYGGDGSYICVGGESAGGHLATMVALSANDAAYQPGFESIDTTMMACIDFYGVHDWFDDHDQYRRIDGGGMYAMIPQIIMQRSRTKAYDEYLRASPVHRLRQYTENPSTACYVPPMMVFCGTNDILTPVADARYFFDQLQQYRVSTRAIQTNGSDKSSSPLSSSVPDVYVELPGAHHGYHILPSVRTFASGDSVVDFLRTVLSHRSTPSLSSSSSSSSSSMPPKRSRL